MALTVEQIHKVANDLAAGGDRPTLAAVRAALGGGSYTTISEALKTWRERQTENHALAEVVVPAAVQEKTQQLQAAIWQAAIAEAERRLQAERDALAEARAAFEAEIAETREAIAVLEGEADATQAEILALKTEADRLEARAEQAEAARREAELGRAADAAAAAARMEGLEARLGDCQATVTALIARVDAPAQPPKK